MKNIVKLFYGSLLILGFAGVMPQAASAESSHWDASCNCRRPDSEYTTHRYVHEKPQIVTYHRVVDRTRVVRGDTKLIQENRVYVHVKPVIHREVVVHRTNTIVRDVYLHRVNPIYRQKLAYRHQVVHRYVQGWTRHMREWREVRDCGCVRERGLFHSGYRSDEGDGERVSYRD